MILFSVGKWWEAKVTVVSPLTLQSDASYLHLVWGIQRGRCTGLVQPRLGSESRSCRFRSLYSSCFHLLPLSLQVTCKCLILHMRWTQLRSSVKSRGGRPRLPVPNKPYGFCGSKATLDWKMRWIPGTCTLLPPVAITLFRLRTTTLWRRLLFMENGSIFWVEINTIDA